MAIFITTYNHLQVPTYQLTELLELRIERRINEHAQLFLTGVIPEDQKDKYVHEAQEQSRIEVNCQDTPIFKGLISSIKVKTVRDIYYLEVWAVSFTQMLDVKLMSRSFLYESMTYTDLFEEVVKAYGANCKDTASEGKALGSFVLQYRETDWQFLKRMASRLNAGLVPDVKQDKPAFFVGKPDYDGEKTIDNANFIVKKDLSRFRRSSENGLIEGAQDMHFLAYEVEAVELIELGAKVKFNERSFFISEVITQMKEGIMRHTYTLVPEEGMRQPKIYNDRIVGLSLQGQVTKVEKDTVTVELQIDQGGKQKVENTFPYSTVYTAEGNSGWYCMPEVNDYVRIYFPDKEEHNGFALNSVRMNRDENEKNNKIGNPDIKYFRTRDGKELMFSPEEIVITGKDGEIFLRLNESDGIEIYSNKEVKITAKKGIIMDSKKKIVMTAKEQINITCKDSKIQMDGTTRISGKNVKTN